MRMARTFEAESRSVADARHYVAHALDGVAIDRDAAELLVSELAANAIGHAGGRFDIEVEITAQRVRIEVVDGAPAAVLAVSERPSARGGFGLRLVDALAQRWGTETLETRKGVWFELGVDELAR